MGGLAVAAFLIQAVAAPADAQRLQPLDAFEIEYATDVQISPDGEWVSFVRNGADVMTDQRTAGAWLADSEGASLRPLGTSSRAPRWSPSGDRVAYITDGADGSRIRVRWLDTGTELEVARLSSPPQDLAWSPDGQQLAFSMFTATAPPPYGALPAPPAGAEWKAPAYITDRLSYRLNGAGLLPAGSSQAYVVPASGGTPRRVTGEGFRYRDPPYAGGGLAWSQDGRELIVAGSMSGRAGMNPLETELFAWSVADGTSRQLTDREGPDYLPRVSPDGGTIAFLGFDDHFRGFQNAQLYVVPSDGGEARSITGGLDRSILDYHWAPDGRSVLVSYDHEGITTIARVSLDGSHEVLAENLGGGPGFLAYGGQLGAGPFSVADNGAFAAVHADPHTPGDVAIGQASGGPMRTITELNADVLDHRQLGRVESIRYPSTLDGETIEGWIVYPPDFDPEERYPLILEIHGGPFAAYGPRFDLEKQLMAARGYVVLYTNPRGSTGYGEAFADAIHHDFPGDEYQDLLAGVDAVVERGFIDPDRLFVTGGSGGGMLTAWVIGKDHRFKAAGVHYPVVDWRSLALTSDVAPYMLRYWLPDTPWDDPEHYRRRSPLSLVDAVTTPTLVLSGERDERTPIGQAEMYYTALKVQGIDAVLVRVPDEPHGSSTHPSHQLAKVLATLDWFDAHGGKEGGDT